MSRISNLLPNVPFGILAQSSDCCSMSFELVSIDTGQEEVIAFNDKIAVLTYILKVPIHIYISYNAARQYLYYVLKQK